MRHRVGRLALLLGVVAIGIAACAPVKPPTPPGPIPGRNVAYYYANDLSLGPIGEFRSVTPFVQPVDSGTGTAAQFLNTNGTVSLAVENAGCLCGAEAGFYTPLFRLGDLVSARLILSPGSSAAFIGLVFDNDGTGQWGDWDANGQSTGLSTDETGIGPLTSGGQVLLDDNRELDLLLAMDTWTLAELKAGNQPGIDANTPVGLFVVLLPDPFNPFGDAHSIAVSLTLNGNELLG